MVKWDASEYNQNSSQLEKWAKGLVLKLSLVGNEKVLDIGSGDGKVTAEIARLLPNGSVIGIDSSNEMIEFSRNKFNKLDFPNLEFELMDMRDIKFNKQFDVVFSAATLHWVEDHLMVLNQIRKCLRVPGKMFLQMGGTGNQQELIQTLIKIKMDTKWVKYFKEFDFRYGYYSVEEYREWLKKTGFTAKRVVLINKDNVIDGVQGLRKWIKLAFSPYVQRIPEEFQADFIDEIVTAYLGKFPLDTKGESHLEMIRLEVEAELLK